MILLDDDDDDDSFDRRNECAYSRSSGQEFRRLAIFNEKSARRRRRGRAVRLAVVRHNHAITAHRTASALWETRERTSAWYIFLRGAYVSVHFFPNLPA